MNSIGAGRTLMSWDVATEVAYVDVIRAGNAVRNIDWIFMKSETGDEKNNCWCYVSGISGGKQWLFISSQKNERRIEDSMFAHVM